MRGRWVIAWVRRGHAIGVRIGGVGVRGVGGVEGRGSVRGGLGGRKAAERVELHVHGAVSPKPRSADPRMPRAPWLLAHGQVIPGHEAFLEEVASTVAKKAEAGALCELLAAGVAAWRRRRALVDRWLAPESSGLEGSRVLAHFMSSCLGYFVEFAVGVGWPTSLILLFMILGLSWIRAVCMHIIVRTEQVTVVKCHSVSD